MCLFILHNYWRDICLKYEFVRRGPWITQFMIDGKPYGGDYRVYEDVRIKQFFDRFPSAKTILDIGSMEGGQTFRLAQHPDVQLVIGIEARKANIRRAEFVRELIGIKNVRFIQGNIEEIDITQYGIFDAVFCSGVLYHLTRPWKLIERLSYITSNLFLWTHYVSEEKADRVINSYRGWWYRERRNIYPTTGLSSKSFWLTLESLKNLLINNDFKIIDFIDIDVNHKNGPCVTIAASKNLFLKD